MRLRSATISDAALLAGWDRQPHVIAASGADDAEDWHQVLTAPTPWRWNMIAEVDGRPVGVVVIIDPRAEETHYWGDVPDGLRAIDIWIGAQDDLGRGLGTRMMILALAQCFAEPAVAAVLIDPLAANVRARRFYERLGFREVGPRRFGADDCVVYRIDRTTWSGRDQAG